MSAVRDERVGGVAEGIWGVRSVLVIPSRLVFLSDLCVCQVHQGDGVRGTMDETDYGSEGEGDKAWDSMYVTSTALSLPDQ